jgi:hypothetical protein
MLNTVYERTLPVNTHTPKLSTACFNATASSSGGFCLRSRPTLVPKIHRSYVQNVSSIAGVKFVAEMIDGIAHIYKLIFKF